MQLEKARKGDILYIPKTENNTKWPYLSSQSSTSGVFNPLVAPLMSWVYVSELKLALSSIKQWGEYCILLLFSVHMISNL